MWKMEPQALHTIKSRARFSKYRPPMGTLRSDSESSCVGCLKGCKIFRWISIFDQIFDQIFDGEGTRSGSCPHKVVFTLQRVGSSAVKVFR